MTRISLLFICILSFVLFIAGCSSPAPTTTTNLNIQESTAASSQKNATVLSLCFLSNVNSGWVKNSSITPQQIATNAIDSVLDNPAVIAEIGTWKRVWGPAVYSYDQLLTYQTSDLTMVLFEGKDPDDTTQTMQVLSISGTNSISFYDWEFLDFMIESMVEWPAAIQGSSNLSAFSHFTPTANTTTIDSGIYISQGLATGMNVLMNLMTDAGGLTLMEYLKQNTGSDTMELAVTGHSLGGALSPCVALSLKDNQTYWNSPRNVAITAWPFAGFSPGNANFASYFRNTIDTTNFYGWYNTNDIAPMAFAYASTQLIPSAYNSVANIPAAKWNCVVQSLFPCFGQQVQAFHYTSLYSPANSFTGTPTLSDTAFTNAITTYKNSSTIRFKFHSELQPKLPACKSLNSDSLYAGFSCFMGLAVQQHFSAYEEHFNCGTVFGIIQGMQGPGFTSDTYKEEWMSHIQKMQLLEDCAGGF